jgi:hypothetical protein
LGCKNTVVYVINERVASHIVSIEGDLFERFIIRFDVAQMRMVTPTRRFWLSTVTSTTTKANNGFNCTTNVVVFASAVVYGTKVFTTKYAIVVLANPLIARSSWEERKKGTERNRGAQS